MVTNVFIVGGDHHNGLGLARALGINGVDVHSIVISDVKKSFLSKSKYVKSSLVFKNEKEAYDYIKQIPISEDACNILIPYSDGAAYELDNRLDEFKDKWKVPSINLEAGKICELMSKEKQYSFAEENGIKMAKSALIDLTVDSEIPDVGYPCILKPNLSAGGSKKDIAICNNEQEVRSHLKFLSMKGYKDILIQEYINIDYEIDVFGCICKNYPYITLTPTKTIRAWPQKKGTNSFSQIIVDEIIVEKCKKIIECLRNINFYGLYDIELFVLQGGENPEIYLNEINLRNSGDVYMGLSQNYYYPYVWVRDVLNLNNQDVIDHPIKGDFCMTELSDFRNVLSRNYGIFKWIKDYRKSSDFALKFKGDMKPVRYRYWQYVTKIFKR